ncbi:MAG: methyltransferase family protein [Leptonema sp. (in: bacteria)]
MEKIFIRFGNFFFRWRDTLFSLILIFGLYSLTLPKEELFFYFGDVELDIILSWIGFFVLLIGILIRVFTIGFIYIKRAGIQKKIYAEVLFQEGLFAHSRNPLYLGNLLVVTGFVITINLIAFWYLILPLFFFIYFCIIKAEEDFLFKKFQDKYLDYYKKVPRLIFGNFSLYPQSFKNLTFSFKRMIKVEHSSHFLIFFSLVLVNLFKFHFRYQWDWSHPFFYLLYLISIVLLLYQGVSFYLKKIGKLDVQES